ncbi:YceI family protein [Pseudoflavitalea sp. G-6-1-2]|uniref:YceI family protein n=1 Tax=Pseudoflavitalea sp. G-6-1-2 TaxID=2728841 RepID=UPI00146F7E3B|nr:YceI family protein [Pseudoflavitalea sp. G-6-1-2]NML20360.1 YceI family protein [Pseudoflavitalea sp. G-6-1-2]
MKKIPALIFLLIAALPSAWCQGKFYTRTGNISFVTKGVLETVKAENKTVTCVLNSQTGQLQFSVLMRGFEFRKALMQEHFNENYVESEKYPNAQFIGQITGTPLPDLSKDGTYAAKVEGKLTLHGITRDISTESTIIVKQGQVHATAAFNILLSDYKIKIPALVKNSLSNTVNIAVACMLQPLQ